MTDGFVYFIQQGDHGPIKVGWSVNPAKRLMTLQASHFERLHLIGLTPGNRVFESCLHEKLAAFSIGREWFEPSSEVLSEIAEPVARVGDALDKAVVAREHLNRAVALLRGSDRDGAHEELLQVLALVNEAVAAHQPQLRLAEVSQ